MNAGLFRVDDHELKSLVNVFKRYPREFQVIVSQILSKIAYNVKLEASKVIGRDMTVRNPKFVDSVLRYTRAKPGNINNQHSEVGSIHKDRFTGWIEQQTGAESQRTRVGTLLSRGGDKTKQIQSKDRLKESNMLLKPEDMGINNARNEEQRIIIFLQMIDRLATSQPFLLRKPFKGFKAGVYRRNKQGGINLIQDLEPKDTQPKHDPWLTKAANDYLSDEVIERLWIDGLKEAISKLQLAK